MWARCSAGPSHSYERSCTMRHVTSPVLRRLHDEPLAVPDTARRHVAACGRCQATSSKIAADATTAARFLGPGTAPAGPGPAGPGTGPPRPAGLPPDTDLAWERIQARLRPPAPDAPHAPAIPRLRKTPARDPWARRPVL